MSTTDSINTNPIGGANQIGTTNTVYGIVTDNTAMMLAAKYTGNRTSSSAATNISSYTTRQIPSASPPPRKVATS